MYYVLAYLTYSAQIIGNNLSASMKLPNENRGYIYRSGYTIILTENHDIL
jgi:hypothetical protein